MSTGLSTGTILGLWRGRFSMENVQDDLPIIRQIGLYLWYLLPAAMD